MPWYRQPSLVEASTRGRWRLRNLSQSKETFLNTVAVAVWEQCDGSSAAEIAAALSGFLHELPTERQVAETLAQLDECGAAKEASVGPPAPVVRLRIDGVPDGPSLVRDYFNWSLTDHFAVLPVSGSESADILLQWQSGQIPDGGPAVDDCLQIAISANQENTRGYDAVIKISDDVGARSACVPGWAMTVDWGPFADRACSVRNLKRVRKQAARAESGWGLVELGGAKTDQSLVNRMTAELGPPQRLFPKLFTPEVGYEAEFTAFPFVLVTGKDLSELGSAAVADAWLLGSIPIYDGAPTSLPAFNSHAILFSGGYPDSASVVDYACWLKGNEQQYQSVHAEPLLLVEGDRGSKAYGAGDPRILGKVLWNILFAGETSKESGSPTTKSRHDVDAADKRLTIGMATYDDYDGVYFSLEAIRLYHPEVLDRCVFVVIDNNPDSEVGHALKLLSEQMKDCRYVRHTDRTGTAIRDRVFREATTDYVLCMDSHVMIRAGAIARLIDYLDRHPACRDLLQGPMLANDHKGVSSHFIPEWNAGMYGAWGSDSRAENPDGEPFEIPMQGLGLFACRRDAWLGFNAEFRGFGGEEGYIHEKYRRAGHRTLCLPFLRWVHRFGRPRGTIYPNIWEDRIRNYLIGFDEVGLDTSAVEQHFATIVDPDKVWHIARQVEAEGRNPFSYFDAMYCINLRSRTARWDAVKQRFTRLGIAERVRKYEAVTTPQNHHIGCCLSHRAIIETARKMGWESVLVFEDDAIFRRGLLYHLERCVAELKSKPWRIFLLGGVNWRQFDGTLENSEHLENGTGTTTSHAVAYHRRCFDDLLGILPGDESEANQRAAVRQPLSTWVIDQCIAAQTEEVYLAKPLLAIQREFRPLLSARDLADFF